jgi:hypothetical protein
MNSAAKPPSFLRRHGLHFISLFALLLTSLVVLQQERTIESQQSLIRLLFHDSVELNHMRIAAFQQRHR